MEEKKELSFEEVNDIRKLIVDAVRSIDDASGKRFKLSKLDCSKELLDRIVFDYRAKFPNGDTYKDVFYEFFKLKSKIDFDGVSFDGAIIAQRDFTGSKGIKINPQTIFFKSLLLTVCSGVEFIGPFDGADIIYANFTDSKGAKINPQTICGKKLCGTKCADVEFIGPFDGVDLCCTDFTGSKGAKINPRTVGLRYTDCRDVEFVDSFDEVIIDDVRMDAETSLEGFNARCKGSFERVKESINKLIK